MGTVPLSRVEWKESISVLREVVDLGVNWFDTARAYWDIELRMGEAFRDIRDRVIIISKSGAKDADKLRTQIDETLERLKTDYLDVFLFHGGGAVKEEAFLAPGGLLEVVEDAKKAGKIVYRASPPTA